MNRTTRNILLLVALILLVIARFASAGEAAMPGIELQGSEWWVEDIDGKGVIDMSHTTIQFAEPGSLAGDSGCNRYTGSVEIDGAAMSFGPLASTRKACAPALMDQEVKFYQALSRVVTWEVPDTSLLHLRDADGTSVIRAWRLEEQD